MAQSMIQLAVICFYFTSPYILKLHNGFVLCILNIKAISILLTNHHISSVTVRWALIYTFFRVLVLGLYKLHLEAFSPLRVSHNGNHYSSKHNSE